MVLNTNQSTELNRCKEDIPDKASELPSYSGDVDGVGGTAVLSLTLSVRLEKARTKLCRCSLRLLLKFDIDPLLKELETNLFIINR